MASQMVDTILSAEKECDRRIGDASARAASIRSDAAKEQAAILDGARRQALDERRRVLENADKRGVSSCEPGVCRESGGKEQGRNLKDV